MARRPLIGCTTYRKTAAQDLPIDVYGLMPSYAAAVQAAGGLPVLIPLNLQQDELSELLARLDGVLLSGGADVDPIHYHGNCEEPTVYGIDSDRDRVEMHLARQAVAQEKPLLAICRGIQVMNVALGGSLWEDVPGYMPGAMAHDGYDNGSRDFLAHEVVVESNSRLARLLGTERIRVNSLHHQGIRELAPTLQAVATAPDGLIEAVEIADHRFALGVQWHPENLLQREPRMLCLFQGFIEAARGGFQ